MSIFISIRLFKGVKYDFFLLFLACKSRNSGELQAITPRQTDFFGENRDFGREFLARWRGKSIEKGSFCPKSGWIERKKTVLGWKSQGGGEAKNGLYCRFCNAMRWQNGCKWNFLAIFFGDLLQGMQKCPTFALAIGKQRSCKRGLRSESDEAAKALLWSLKVLHNRL